MNHSIGAAAETQRLSDAVISLTAEDAQLKSRIAALEHSMDDITGSVTREIQSAKAATSSSWPAGAQPIPATVADITALLAPIVPPPDGVTYPFALVSAGATAPIPHVTEYGVDLGTAVSIDALRARWAEVRTAHPQLFTGVLPTVTLKAAPRTNKVEVRLMLGPLANAEVAVQLCAALEPFRIYCQPIIFDGQHLALR